MPNTFVQPAESPKTAEPPANRAGEAPKNGQKPSIGRTVFYQHSVSGTNEPIPRVAFITSLEADPNSKDHKENRVGLAILNPEMNGNIWYEKTVPQGKGPGCWDWPPRVE